MIDAMKLYGLGAGILAAMVLVVRAEAPVMAQREEKLGTSLVCTLTGPELRERRTGLIARLRASAQEFRELETGWSMRYPEEQVGELIEFIRLERKCCTFFEFTLRFEPGTGPVWLSVTGPPGAKTIIGAELRPAARSTPAK